MGAAQGLLPKMAERQLAASIDDDPGGCDPV
jgi:hypothetical protein